MDNEIFTYTFCTSETLPCQNTRTISIFTSAGHIFNIGSCYFPYI